MTYANQLAYPFTYEEEVGDYGRKQLVTHEGLTKREYFAAMAMQGLLSVPTMQDDPNVYGEAAAKFSVYIADALIEQLNK